jgi:hypothetical protein
MVLVYNSTYMGDGSRKVIVKGLLKAKAKHYLKKS